MIRKSFWAFLAAALLMVNGCVAEGAEIATASVSGGDAYVGTVEEVVQESGTVEVEVMSTSTDLTISSDYTLSEDTTIEGDLIITGGNVSLNGYTLTVGGDVIFSAGNMYICGGKLDIAGNFSMGSKGEMVNSITRYATSTAFLVMNNSTDVVIVGGDYEVCSAYGSLLTDGTMYIGGDFAQYGTYYVDTFVRYASAYSFNASENHKVVFSNDATHSIFFDSTYSGFGKVDFGNGNIEIVNTIRGFTLDEDLTWNFKESGYNIAVGGTLDLNGHTLYVKGDMNLTSGTIDLNSGSLEVEGNFSLGTEGSYGTTRNASSQAILIMDYEADEVVIGGDFVTCSCYGSTLSDGTMYIGGDFYQYGNYASGTWIYYATAYSFNATGSHKVIFSNDAAHKIYFESPYYSGFGRVDFGNGVITIANGLRGLTLEDDAEWTLKQPADCIGFINTWDLNGHCLTINGNVNLTAGVLDFNEGCLQVNGDFSLGKKGDSRKATSSARMIMEYEKDTLIVSGDFSICSNYESTLNAGTFYLTGDFAQYGNSPLKNGYDPATAYSFRASEPHKVVLCGTEPQSVLFEGVGYARFGIVEFHMPSENYTFNPNGQCWQTLIPYTTVQVRNFVERMYTVALNRASDPTGVAYWTDVLVAKQSDGASLSAGFILGSEFTGKNYSNEEYIEVLYRTFFCREADDEGKAYWLSLLEGGHTRETVLAGYVNSNEFFNLCGEYGISRGVLRGDGTAVNPGIYQFAERLYSKILERNGDKDGIEYWTNLIDSRACTPEDAAMNFFFSPEYVAKNNTDEEYIKALYRTFMGREADEGGLSAWKTAMDNGTSREVVLSSFAQSAEFKGIMAEYGL